MEWPPSGTVVVDTHFGANVLDDNFLNTDAVDIELDGGGRVRMMRVGDQFQVVGSNVVVDSPDYALFDYANRAYVATLYNHRSGEAGPVSVESRQEAHQEAHQETAPTPAAAATVVEFTVPSLAKKPKKSKV
jgi:hypothetical protein